MTENQALREHLMTLLEGKNAHVDLKTALDKLGPDDLGKRPPGASYTLWELLEHMRLAQWDILEFSRNKDHVSPEFPEGYWPESRAPESEEEWASCKQALLSDLEAMKGLVSNPEIDLLAEVPGGDGPTLLREALLVADHNAYHLGQLVLMMKMLGRW